MAYGIELRNADGLKVVEFKKTLYLKETGVTAGADVSYDDGTAKAVAAGYPFTFPLHRGISLGQSITTNAPFSRQTPIISRTLGAEGQFAAINGRAVITPRLCLSLGDMVFLQISTHGLQAQCLYFFDIPGITADAGFCALNTEGMNDIPYAIASPTPPSGEPSENYGFQIFDAAGEKTFDSRYPLFSVAFSLVIPQSVVSAVLSTGTPHDITLPVSMPNCYVASPFFSAFYSVQSSLLRSLMLKQINSTTLRLSRETVYTTGSPSGTTRTFIQDIPVFVSRGP